ncbi:MAG TPA: M13 family metallopeptidase [Verrucomicrobiae bacterium]|jgi:putative endopeptidase
MKMKIHLLLSLACAASFTVWADDAASAPPVPRFSTKYLDRSANPGADFYGFANGQWIASNPVPADKSRWGAFSELAERNWFSVHEILDETARAKAAAHSPRRQVGDFYLSAMNTNRIEQLGLKPIQADLKRIERVKSAKSLFSLVAEFHDQGVGGLFGAGFGPDEKNSSIYALELGQGGLSLPDRDYYLKDSFAEIRGKYLKHVEKMFLLLGEKPADAATNAATVLAIETGLAKASRTRVELRDADKNYNKFATAELVEKYPALPWTVYFGGRNIAAPEYEIVGQPEFFGALNRLVQERPLSDWKTYLRWHLLRASAAYLPAAFEQESFAFFGRTLSGQPEQEPRWKRAAHVIDGSIGEALGELYVQKCFPPEARARMVELVANLKAVYRDRIATVPWMTGTTRAKALAKFDKFTQKIGCPEKFRDYSSLEIRPDDYFGNVRRAEQFESKREIARIGKAVDRTEWGMTPETVNAYYNPSQNEIVFPAGILQPPFFDFTLDDAVNYGGIGVVIGHEMTHGFDDQGRKFDGDGNLSDWWTEADAKAFESRAQKVVDEFNGFEVLPGLHVNGQLTLGENLADLGGVTIAYEALQRALAQDPSQRKNIDGFTPEQRFFLSFAQVWRMNVREAEARRLITVDPHSPGKFRANGSLMNVPEFFDAWGIKEGAPMWRPPEQRAKIW